MKYLLSFLAIFSITTSIAQEKLAFNTRFVESEDQWVAFEADSIGSHHFGFIYIDETAGLTLNHSGSFTVNEDGTFLLKKKEGNSSLKVRLENNGVLIAVIPDSHLTELEVQKVPEWLHIYKNGENSVSRLYNWGYRYNGWNECAKALTFLEKAYKMEPDYNGLRVEMAFSYNCLESYQKAIDILEKAVKHEPNNAYLYKELLYAEVHSKQFKKAVATYEKVMKDIADKSFNGENAYNILGAYYLEGNVKAFNAWLSKTKVDKDEKFGVYVEQLKNNLKDK